MGPASTTPMTEGGPRLVTVETPTADLPPPPPTADPVLTVVEPEPPSPPPPATSSPDTVSAEPPPPPPAADAMPAEGPAASPAMTPPPAPAGWPGYPPPPGYPPAGQAQAGIPPGYPPPGYLPPGYPPFAYPHGFYPPPYPFAPPPPATGAAADWAGQPPAYPYPPPPYPPIPYPPPYPAAYYPPPAPPQQPAAQTAPPPPAASPTGKPPLSAAEKTVQAQNQQLLITGIIAAVLLIHLPWLLYLYGVHGCFGTFIEACRAADPAATDLDSTAGTPMLFARVAFFMLRVQTVLSVDFAKFSEVLQLSTGLGSFALTKIVAANGMVATGNLRRFALAGTCAVAFVVLFWAELHLTGSTTYAVLGDETVLAYIDLELPPDFLVATEAQAGLMQYLQILRLADALIFGAALAMPRATKGA